MKLLDLLESPQDDLQYALDTKWSEMDEDIVLWLRARGFKSIGYGVFGEVFRHPSDPSRVIKVVDTYDRCFLSFLRYIIKNQSNPHVPRYYGSKQIPLDEFSRDPEYRVHGVVRRRFFAILESLEPIHKIENWHTFIPWKNNIMGYLDFCVLVACVTTYVGDFAQHTNKIGIVKLISELGEQFPFYDQPYAKVFTRLVDRKIGNAREIEPLIEIGIKSIGNESTPFSSAVKDIIVKNPGNCSLDIHHGNIMMRPTTGDLVVVDPYAEKL